MNSYTIYLANPAYEWENASPIGCGRLGAMLYGTVNTERLQLNEEHIWAGDPMEIDAEGFREKLDTVRDILRAGKSADDKAKELLEPYFRRVCSYETAGELLLDTGKGDDCTDYARRLDLCRGVVGVTYKQNGVTYTRTAFASHEAGPRGAVVLHLTADRAASVSFTASYVREGGMESVSAEGCQLIGRGKTAVGDHGFEVRVRFDVTGGTIAANGDGTVTVKDADSVTIVIGIECGKEIVLPEEDYETLLAAHTADFSAIMGRADIAYDYDEALDEIPANERLARVKAGETDAGLVNLYFQFGRYLLLSSSRPDKEGNGALPANLQGVWNGYLKAPWGSDYHTNINLQMNYWHAESANLSECALPLFDYINNYLLPGGMRVAKDFYHCRGAVLHHLSDVYGFASPADGLWGLWPMGGAWLCYSMWEHYLFGGDLDFLRNTAYPYISACTRFFLDNMFEDENGYLCSGPSTSPENSYYIEENGKKTSVYLCLTPTMDVEIISGLFEMYLETEKLLGIDPAQAEETRTAYGKLPPLKIGSEGQLLEWDKEYEEKEPGHRHISHAFALYPGWTISEKTPELMAAIDTTIKRRLSHGGGHTGWSCAWLINLFARLGQGDDAAAMIAKLFSNSTKDNLFDSHPPFQIDGNFGASAAMAEMLLQSHTGTLVFLPALPSDPAYQNGSFEGLRARGGITASADWIDGRVVCVNLTADRACRVTIRVNGTEETVSLPAGKKREFLFS